MDVLVVILDSEAEVIRNYVLEDGYEMKGMRVNLSKTRLMVGGKRHNTKKTVGKWPCAVCGKGVGSNLRLCINCQ